MRTTLTTDDDVAILLEQVQRQRKESFKEVVNAALRQALSGMQDKPKPRSKFRTRSLALGRCYLPNLDNIAEVLATGERENYT